jgi:hypothetical protein
MNKASKFLCLVLLSLGLASQVGATSLDTLEEMALYEVTDYMKSHNMPIQHGPAIISGSFKRIVLEATFVTETGGQKTVTFVKDPNNRNLGFKSMKIH